MGHIGLLKEAGIWTRIFYERLFLEYSMNGMWQLGFRSRKFCRGKRDQEETIHVELKEGREAVSEAKMLK